MLKHVLVPLDGSALAEKALDYAVQIVAPKRRITLLYIIEVPDNINSFYTVPTEQPSIEDAINSARDYLNQVSTDLKQDHDLRVTVDIKTGRPANVITDVAETEFVDAIVMSTHGRTGIERFIFGSVTQKVLNAMPCPVFVVPNRSDEA